MTRNQYPGDDVADRIAAGYDSEHRRMKGLSVDCQNCHDNSGRDMPG